MCDRMYMTTSFKMVMLLTFISMIFVYHNHAHAYGKPDLIKEVLSYVSEFYPGNISEDELTAGAIDGIMSKLDSASTYLTPDEFKNLREISAGKSSTIILKVSECRKKCVIASIEKPENSQEEYPEKGDILSKIENISVAGMSDKKVNRILESMPQEFVSIEIIRGTETKTLKINLHKTPPDTVSSKVLQEGLLYIKISSFAENTASLIRQQLTQDQKITMVILDLRDNPGGLLTQAIATCDHFLNEGEILSVRGKKGVVQRSYSASSKAIFNGKLAILINSRTASASEIVASALQEQGRATVIGNKSFGKGSVQTIIPLSNGGAIKITHSLYYTPSGSPIQNSGVIPDIEVEQPDNGSDIQLSRAIEVLANVLTQKTTTNE